MKSKLKWWEKTVEYKFILDAVKNSGMSFASPFSGIEEMASDAVFAKDAEIILVEFKKSVSELDLEYDKFYSYNDAENDLIEQDKHHFLIYGELSSDNKLMLNACRYFDRTQEDNALDVFSKGVSEEYFKSYIEKFLAHKKMDGRSSGTIGSDSVVSVIGLMADKKVSSISLYEYCRIAAPELYELYIFRDKKSNSYSPSFGGG